MLLPANDPSVHDEDRKDIQQSRLFHNSWRLIHSASSSASATP
jgi:hypothetical protein